MGRTGTSSGPMGLRRGRATGRRAGRQAAGIREGCDRAEGHQDEGSDEVWGRGRGWEVRRDVDRAKEDGMGEGR